MISIRILFFLFIFLFFSNALYAESLHFDCKCNFGKYERYDLKTDERSEERNNYCADTHLQIEPATKRMRVINTREWLFLENIIVTNISFKAETGDVEKIYQLFRFDRYTSTLTSIRATTFLSLNTKEVEHEVFRCEEVNKKY